MSSYVCNMMTKLVFKKQLMMLNPQLGFHTYYVYIITNKYRSTFYIGMTNNLKIRLQQHKNNIETNNKTFASKYNIEFLVFYEKFTWVQEAIAREKELKKWRRDKKLALIRDFNPKFEFLNYHFE
jgi:putative endonuclease